MEGLPRRRVAVLDRELITLPQADLPKDSGILRTAAQHNAVNVGVYASVINGGTIRRGDTVVLA